VPSLFRRRSTDLIEDAVDSVEEPAEEAHPTKGYTPSKRELGVTTPKRSSAQRRRGAEPPPANRREAARRMRERQRAQRSESMEGMRRGDERFLLARDRGPERALVRNIVDSRRNAGTWFFGGALIVLVGSSVANPLIQLVSNLLWAFLALAVVADAVLISRRIKKLVRERFPDTTQRMRSLYTYGIMRSITFRRMRMPKPQVDIGEAI
jgi:Protein of unknown function (DUF3043)